MQLNLLDWQPPRRVLVFPLARRVVRVRNVAEKLSQKSGFVAEAYWKQTVSTLRGQMERAGIETEVIDQELRSFFDAVQAELNRMAYASRGHPGGAA